jgi:pyroglutamyl-peptidase
MKLLLTAFEPFGGQATNPALEALRLLPQQVGEVEIVTCTVPTVFAQSIPVVAQAIRQTSPDAVLCIGQAGGRAGLTLERVAINIDDASIPDNVGDQPIDQPICPEGPAAYFATLPIKAMVQAIRQAGLPASVSNTAGTYVCNHLMYGVLHLLATEFPAVRGGFLHVPYAPEQTVTMVSTMPSMSLANIATGIQSAIAILPHCHRDIVAAEGQTH